MRSSLLKPSTLTVVVDIRILEGPRWALQGGGLTIRWGPVLSKGGAHIYIYYMQNYIIILHCIILLYHQQLSDFSLMNCGPLAVVIHLEATTNLTIRISYEDIPSKWMISYWSLPSLITERWVQVVQHVLVPVKQKLFFQVVCCVGFLPDVMEWWALTNKWKWDYCESNNT